MTTGTPGAAASRLTLCSTGALTAHWLRVTCTKHSIGVQENSRFRLLTPGEIEFESVPDEGETRLDFDVDLATVEVREDDPDAAVGDACPDTALLFGVAETEPEICSFLERELPLLNIGPDPDAKGKVRLRRDSSCSRDLRVEIEKLPQGAYHLVFRNPDGDEPVMDIPKSFQEIDPDHGEIEGEWVLGVNPEPGEILFPCEIEPLGMRITIEQGGTTYLEHVFE